MVIKARRTRTQARGGELATIKLLHTFLLVCTAIGFQPVIQAQETYGQPQAPLVAEVLGMDIRTIDAEEMKYVILGKLLDRYTVERGIEVTRTDIDAYIDAMRRVAEQDRQQRAMRRDELLQQLAETSPDGAEYQALSSELESLDQLAASLDELASDAGEDRAARETVASAFIRQWKINRALYQQYGGRIIFQQSGPEPLDAYRAFLEEQQAKGAFRIADKSLEAEFWKYYRSDSMHSFYPAGSREEGQAFDTPWWLSEGHAQAK